jgi:hypothetical protein
MTFLLAPKRLPFAAREGARLIKLKAQLLSPAACVAGSYSKSGQTYDVCLPHPNRTENLFSGFRDEAVRYFTTRRIKWHSLAHLLCSQTCCVNFWFTYMHEPDKLASVLRALGYPVKCVLPFELDSLHSLRKLGWKLEDNEAPSTLRTADDAKPAFLAFEWIGAKNYLSEIHGRHVAGDTSRTRGQRFSSVDVAVRFQRTDGRIEIVLIEWKYTERYPSGRSLRYGKPRRDKTPPTDRLDSIYLASLKRPECQIVLGETPPESLFFDPFDQMMRHQLLASAMEREREVDADIVSYLHIAPRANEELLNCITSPALVGRGKNVHDVWATLVKPDRFKAVYTEDLLPIVTRSAPDPAWADYMRLRYGGMA